MQPVHVIDPERPSRERLAALLQDEYVVSVSDLLDWRTLLAELHRCSLLIIDDAALDGTRYAPLHGTIRLGGPPVLILSSARDEDDAIAALNAGAADYVRKPFSDRELRARVRAILRRDASAGPRQALRFTAGGRSWSLEDQSYRLLDGTGCPVQLSAQEYHLLRTFLQSPNRVLSREYLMQALSSISAQKQQRSVDVCVSRLRMKLGNKQAGYMDAIRTVRSEGYVLECGPSTNAGRLAEDVEPLTP